MKMKPIAHHESASAEMDAEGIQAISRWSRSAATTPPVTSTPRTDPGRGRSLAALASRGRLAAVPSVFFTLIVGVQCAFALDPFHSPELWEEYQNRIIQNRDHEKPGWTRPVPGKSPLVAMQTLILPEFKVEGLSPDKAFDAWQQCCEREGLKLQVYLDPAVSRNGQIVSHHAKGDTAARCLSYLNKLSMTTSTVLNDVLLVGPHSELEPHQMRIRTWILSEQACALLKLDAQDHSKKQWKEAESSLIKSGVAFPPGSYADFWPDIRSLVVINTSVTLNGIGELITEAESQVAIEQFKPQGLIRMEGYDLEVRSHRLQKHNAAKLRARLQQPDGKLTPFAVSTMTWCRFRGILSPAGSAAWLDQKSDTLWLRNRPDQLDAFIDQLIKAEAADVEFDDTKPVTKKAK